MIILIPRNGANLISFHSTRIEIVLANRSPNVPSKLHETVLQCPSMPPVAQISGTLPPFVYAHTCALHVQRLHVQRGATIRVTTCQNHNFSLSPRYTARKLWKSMWILSWHFHSSTFLLATYILPRVFL